MAFGRSCCKVFTVSLVPVTVFILSLMFMSGVVLLPTLYTELSHKEQYGIVMDAGSTHTHIYLYSWVASSHNYTAQVQQITSCRTAGGGVSSYRNASKAAGPIRLCLNGVLKQVPKEYKGHLEVWFGATAGMRLLKIENSTLAEDILKNIRHTLRSLGINHRQVRIISGGEEGAVGWITSNYLQGTLNKQYPRTRDLTDPKSFGSLDMGGASMQFAFEQTPPTTNHSFAADLFGHEFDLYSRSYLCFGINEAHRRALAYLAMENDFNDSVTNPCLPKGFNLPFNASDLFNHSCTSDIIPDSEDYDYNAATLITFEGTSDPDQCYDLMEKALNFSKCFVNRTTAVDCSNDRVPNVTAKNFLAFSEFYYTADFFNTSRLDSSTFTKYNNSVIELCKQSWEEIQQNHTSPKSYLDKCFYGLYLSHSLQNGLGVSPSHGSWNITFKQQIDNIDAGWALGYMLNRTYKYNTSPNHIVYPYSSADLIVGILVLTILTVVFIIFFAFTFSACRKALKPVTAGYTNIS